MTEDIDRRTMKYWLARTLREARERAGVPRATIANLVDTHETNIARFESHKSFTQDFDHWVAVYAEQAGIEDGRELWRRALKDWERNGSAPVRGPLTPAQQALLLALEAAQRSQPHADESQETRNTTQKIRQKEAG